MKSRAVLVGIGILFLAALAMIPSAPAVAADSPDDVIAELVGSYLERNFTRYDAVLDDDFVFMAADDDVNQYGLPPVIGRALELTITQTMFSGQPVHGAPPILGFQLDLVPSGIWEDAPAPFVGTQVRDYDAFMTVAFAGGNTLDVRGRQRFYVSSQEVSSGQGKGTVYLLNTWRDLGEPIRPKSTETVSWGRLKLGPFPPTVPIDALTVGELKTQFDAP